MHKKPWYHVVRFNLLAVLCVILLLTPGLAIRPALARQASANDARLAAVHQTMTWLKVVSWGPGRLDVFRRSEWDGDVWVRTYDSAAGGWYAWNPLGELPTGKGVDAIEAVSWGYGRLDVFAVESNSSRTVWHKAWNGSWGSWVNIGNVSVSGGSGSDTAGPGGIRAISWGPGRIDLFTSGTYGSAGTGPLQHKWFSGSVWGPSQTGWATIGGTPAIGHGYKIDVVSWAPGRLDIFRRSQDDSSIAYRYWNGTSWQPTFGAAPLWMALNGQSPRAPYAVSWAPNRIDLFMRGTDGAIWANGTDNGSASWFGWYSLGGGAPGQITEPTADAWGPNRLDVFENRRTDFHHGNVYHRAWTGSSWTDWEHLGAIADGDAPEVVSWSANRLDLFAYVADGQTNGIYHKWWDGAWGPSQTGWEFLGNP